MSLPASSAEVTDEFLCGRVAEYQRQQACCTLRCSLLEYMGMTADEYAGWFQTGKVPARVARVWSIRAS